MAKPDGVLTPKQLEFCKQYVELGSAKEAYLAAYETKSESVAHIEGKRLLGQQKILDYILELQKPIRVASFKERDKKRAVLWEMINNPDTSNADKCRAMDILNKLDGEYVNVNRNIEEKETDISMLDLEALRQLAN